jgi:hypothetical protein
MFSVNKTAVTSFFSNKVGLRRGLIKLALTSRLSSSSKDLPSVVTIEEAKQMPKYYNQMPNNTLLNMAVNGK